MSNSKISALTSATTPLAGTETLPVVQSSTTKQVSVANLTAGRAVSGLSFSSTKAYANTSDLGFVAEANIPGWNLRSTGGGRLSMVTGYIGADISSLLAGTGTNNPGTEVMRVTHSSGAVNFISSNVTLQVGNLIQGTAGKGINFTANTPAAGMTSQLLNWYEEGTWTPSIANSFNNYTHTIQVGRYTRIGNLVTLEFTVAWTTTNAGAFSFFITGLPFTPVTLTNYVSAGAIGAINNLTNTNQIVCQVESATSQIKFYARVSGSSATALASANWNTAGTANKVSGTITYQV